MRRITHAKALLLLVVLLAAAGCASTSRQPVVVIEGAEQTAAAATAYFAAGTAIAAAPTPAPGPTLPPYLRPTDDPAFDPETVIATAGGLPITLREYRERVRYERYLALQGLAANIQVARLTPADVADPDNAMAPTVAGVLFTLAEADAFGETVLTTMIRERIMHAEHRARGLAPDTHLYNNLWLNLLGLEPPGDGSLPVGFEEAQAAYLARIAPYTAITSDEIAFKLTVRSEQQALLDAMGAEANIQMRALEVRHILLPTEEEAREVLALLDNGADFGELARSRSLDESARGNGGDLGFFGRGEMVDAFEAAAFAAEAGAVVGPVQTEYGFHVIQVLEREYAYELRRIVVATAAEAAAVQERLAAGEAFETLVEEVSLFPADGGYAGWYSRETLPAAWLASIVAAGIGDVVGPLQTADGFNLIQIVDEEVDRVRARHILVATEAEARQVIDRLAAGEDFATLAAEVSLDSGARPNDGNLGFLTSDQMPAALAAAVYAAEPGVLLGPVETESGFHLAEVLDSRVTILTPNQIDEEKALHFQNWLRREVRAVEIDDSWQRATPADPRPVDIAPVLGEFEAALNAALEALSVPTVTPQNGG